uniref:Uncharacterized protein n=1 Tax=Caenorhabditis japonica TaxID=281687 RepID=A0A8R1E897_CAEJA
MTKSNKKSRKVRNQKIPKEPRTPLTIVNNGKRPMGEPGNEDMQSAPSPMEHPHLLNDQENVAPAGAQKAKVALIQVMEHEKQMCEAQAPRQNAIPPLSDESEEDEQSDEEDEEEEEKGEESENEEVQIAKIEEIAHPATPKSKSNDGTSIQALSEQLDELPKSLFGVQVSEGGSATLGNQLVLHSMMMKIVKSIQSTNDEQTSIIARFQALQATVEVLVQGERAANSTWREFTTAHIHEWMKKWELEQASKERAWNIAVHQKELGSESGNQNEHRTGPNTLNTSKRKSAEPVDEEQSNPNSGNSFLTIYSV